MMIAKKRACEDTSWWQFVQECFIKQYETPYFDENMRLVLDHVDIIHYPPGVSADKIDYENGCNEHRDRLTDLPNRVHANPKYDGAGRFFTNIELTIGDIVGLEGWSETLKTWKRPDGFPSSCPLGSLTMVPPSAWHRAKYVPGRKVLRIQWYILSPEHYAKLYPEAAKYNAGQVVRLKDFTLGPTKGQPLMGTGLNGQYAKIIKYCEAVYCEGRWRVMLSSGEIIHVTTSHLAEVRVEVKTKSYGRLAAKLIYVNGDRTYDVMVLDKFNGKSNYFWTGVKHKNIIWTVQPANTKQELETDAEKVSLDKKGMITAKDKELRALLSLHRRKDTPRDVSTGKDPRSPMDERTFRIRNP